SSPLTFRASCTRKGQDLVKLVANSRDYDLVGGGTLVLADIPGPPVAKTTPVADLRIERRFEKGTFDSLQAPEHGPGCLCGQSKIITTSPSNPKGKVGDWIRFDWDGRWLCRGQGVGDPKGTIYWDGHTVDDLPDSYG